MATDLELVYIEWEDASSCEATTEWVDRANAPAPQPVIFRQTGFVVEIDLDAVVLTEAYSSELMAPRTRIPMGMVRRCVHLDRFVKAPE